MTIMINVGERSENRKVVDHCAGCVLAGGRFGFAQSVSRVRPKKKHPTPTMKPLNHVFIRHNYCSSLASWVFFSLHYSTHAKDVVDPTKQRAAIAIFFSRKCGNKENPLAISTGTIIVITIGFFSWKRFIFYVLLLQ